MDDPAGPSTAGLPGTEVGSVGPRIVLVHGFTQTRASWTIAARDLAQDHRVLVVDAPGHGEAGHDPTDLVSGAARLGHAGGRAVYVGYSMGGRLALRLALDRPDLVAGLVLIGATAGIEDPDQRHARRAADEALADEVERDGVRVFLERWLRQPLFADLVIDPMDLAARRANRPTGLAGSLRLSGTATMDPPWWDELGRIDAPTLVLAGEHDQKFTGLGRRLAAGIGPNARFEVVSDAGHAAHLERAQAVAERVRSFVAINLEDRRPDRRRPGQSASTE